MPICLIFINISNIVYMPTLTLIQKSDIAFSSDLAWLGNN